jgi:hypothetical protein
VEGCTLWGAACHGRLHEEAARCGGLQVRLSGVRLHAVHDKPELELSIRSLARVAAGGRKDGVGAGALQDAGHALVKLRDRPAAELRLGWAEGADKSHSVFSETAMIFYSESPREAIPVAVTLPLGGYVRSDSITQGGASRDGLA